MHGAGTYLLLNIGHALDHMLLLIFATAVVSISSEFGLHQWEELMPYGVTAFFFFGLGALPAGRLGDIWGRRPMMALFFFGIGFASIVVSFANTPMQLSIALGLLGCAASIYHPVGIPMLVQGSLRPGWMIGVNGLFGNLGIASAAIATGFLVKYYGWRIAFLVPGFLSILCGIAFVMCTPKERISPSKNKSQTKSHITISIPKILFIMTVAATSAGTLFNFSTSSNYELLASRFISISQDPAKIGLFLGVVYVIASFAQLIVGKLIDLIPIKKLYLSIVIVQFFAIILAMQLDGWSFYILQILFMATIFGIVPFTDAMIVRFVDDGMRSRVAGMRLAVSLTASSLAVWFIGPIVKSSGFTALLAVMGCTSLVTFLVVSMLPSHVNRSI